MKSILEFLKTIGWAISLVFVYPYAFFKLLITRRKAKKYKKYNYDYIIEERYDAVYKLTKLIKYIKRAKIKNFSDKEKVLAKPQLIICNHRSMLDPMLLFNFLYPLITTNFVFVAKKELQDSKYGAVLDFIDTIYLDRNNLRDAIKVIEQEKEVLKNAKAVVIFPEGTRNSSDELLEFKSGALEPAYKAVCPIQPMVITNTEQYLENKVARKNRKPITLSIMDDIKPCNFISIDRLIFAKNLQKAMQDKYNKIIKNETKSLEK